MRCYMDKAYCGNIDKGKNIFFWRDGYRVKILDAYRPISAQKKFWEIMPDDDFVARPPDMEKNQKLSSYSSEWTLCRYNLD